MAPWLIECNRVTVHPPSPDCTPLAVRFDAAHGDDGKKMTVDWDEELRKLNASEYGKRRADRDLTKDIDDPEALKWAKSNANKAQSAVQETSYKV